MFAAPKHINKTRDDKRINMSVHALASCLVQAKSYLVCMQPTRVNTDTSYTHRLITIDLTIYMHNAK